MAGVSRDLVNRLYTAPPEEFVAARTEAVAAARAAGDVQAARELAALRKPTLAAWLVNLLAIRRPELMAELVDLSAALRAAQRELRGPQLRELSAQRRGAVGGLVAAARALATEADPGLAPGKLPLAEVESTLNAALSDVDIAEQVRSGRLVRPVTYAGFGEVPRPQLRLVTGGLAEPRPERGPREAAERDSARPAPREEQAGGAAVVRQRADRAAREARRRALARELAQARTRQEQAESELAAAVTAEHDGAGALAEIEAALADLERRRAAAEQELGRRKLARKAAERALTAARRRAGEVQAAVETYDADEGLPETGAGEQTRPREPEPPPGGPGRRRR